eukprot:scaffold2075_cov444-Prasinococcus_capsulatus_cf.AAC.11
MRAALRQLCWPHRGCSPVDDLLSLVQQRCNVVDEETGGTKRSKLRPVDRKAQKFVLTVTKLLDALNPAFFAEEVGVLGSSSTMKAVANGPNLTRPRLAVQLSFGTYEASENEDEGQPRFALACARRAIRVRVGAGRPCLRMTNGIFARPVQSMIGLSSIPYLRSSMEMFVCARGRETCLDSQSEFVPLRDYAPKVSRSRWDGFGWLVLYECDPCGMV